MRDLAWVVAWAAIARLEACGTSEEGDSACPMAGLTGCRCGHITAKHDVQSRSAVSVCSDTSGA